jgi:ATP-dependent helicase/DNAse subunit B
MKTGEMSRFLYQLKYESGFNVIEKNVVNEIAVENKKEISYIKDDAIMEKLNLLACNEKKPLSPTAINEYLSCKLKFYFKYIKGLKEEEEIIEEVDPRIFGMIFHDSMEKIYEKKKHQEIDKDYIDNLLKNIIEVELILTEAFNTHYTKNTRHKTLEGKDRIIYDILLKYIKEVLRKDKALCPFTILATEGYYKLAISIDDKKYYIGGTIDRVDETNTAIRVIDYKTGKADTTFTSIEDLFGEEAKLHNKAALQTLLYCMMYEPKCTNNKEITPGIYALKEIFTSKYEYRLSKKEGRKSIPVTDYREHKADLNKGLETLIKEIFDQDSCFTQTEDRKACSYCPYKEICHR